MVGQIFGGSEFEPKLGVVAEPSSCLEGQALQCHEMLVQKEAWG